MKEFKEPGVSLLRRDRLAAGLVGLVAFAVYAATLSPGLYVGESMWSSAQALGYVPALSPANALQFGVAGVCMRFLHFTLGANIHWFGALCGALCAALLFRLAAFFTHQVIHEEHCLRKDRPISLVAGLGTSLVFAFSPGGWVAATRFTIHLVDLLMLLAVLHLFVLYARRPLFATLAALAALYGAGVAQSAYFAMFAPLVALGCVLALWRDDSLSLVRAAWLASAFLAGLALSYAATALVFAAVRDTAAAGEATAWELVKQMIQHGAATIQSLLPEKAWIWLLLTAPAPWMISLFIAGRTLNNERLWSHYALHTGMTALTLMALLGAFASPWFISQSNPRAMIPLFSYALVAMTAGYLLAYGWLLMTVRRGSRSVVDPNSPVFLMGRPMGQILFIALAAGAAAAGALNYVRNVDGSKERFLNEVAGGVVDRLEGRDWIILNTKVDSNYMEFYLRHLARKDDRELNVINMFAPERHRAAITANIRGKLIGRLPEAGRQSMVNSLNLGVSTFITDLYGRYPGFTTTNVVNWGFPDMIMNSGIRPVPEFAYFGSGLSWKGKTAHEMLGEYEAFLERMDALLPHTKEPVALLDHLRNDLRRHMGFLMNNYGVALADSPTAETPQAEKDAVERAAYAFFKRVVAYSPENISARINVFQIAATSKLPDIGAEKEAVGDELQDFADGLKNRYTLYAITSHFGYVRSRQIYEMILKMYTGSPDTQNIAKQFRDLIIFADGGEPGGGSFADGSPEARVDTLERSISESPKEARHYIEIVRLCIRLNRMEDAEKWIREAERQNFGIDFAFEQATLLLAAGKTGEARQILQGLVESKPKHYEALSLLSFIMMDQQDVTGVQRYVLDKIEREEGSRKGYHYQLVSGKLAMLKAAMALAAKNENEAIELQRGARDHFHNAFKTRPQVEALSTLVLELDFALGDSSKARGHATEFLRRDRNHPAANWVLGSLLFQDGDYLAAEEYFKQSIEARVEKKLPPDARSLNDYAEVLRRLNRPVESERHAREALAAAAVEKSPRYASAAYDTLARAIYAQGGRLAEAKAASDEAVRTSLENKIPLSAQFKLTQLQIAVARNAVDEAKTLAGEIQDEVARRQDALDKEERMEFNKLRDLAAKM